MATIQVAVINSSTVLTASQVQAAIPALQIQVHRDFAPIWGIDADLLFIPSGGQPPAGAWWLALADNSDQAGALGYHDLSSEGLPLGKVFAATDEQYGEQWTVTASHELLEMLADPYIDLTTLVQTSNSAGRLYAYEVCDACEADQFGYQIDGVHVSDFVYPAWFESFWAQGSTTFDRQKHLKQPFQLLPGGYIGVFDFTGGLGWTQITTKDSPVEYRTRPRVGSRRERRRTPRDLWLRSQVRTASAMPAVAKAPRHAARTKS